MGTFIFFGLCGIVLATGMYIVFTTVRFHWFTPKNPDGTPKAKNP